MSVVYKSDSGLEVTRDDYYGDGVKYTITGNVPQSYTIKEMESAYDFEAIVSKLPCSGIEFDSEYCQFFAYAKTKQIAIAYVKRIENHFKKIQKLF